MKKAVLAVVLVLMMGVLAPFARAIEADSGPASMARYYSDDFELFFAMRVDEGYVETLNALANRVLGNVPSDANLPVPPSLDFNALLQGAFASAPFTYDDVRSFLGDYVSVGVQNYAGMMQNDMENAGLLIAIDLKDTNGFTDFLNANVPGGLPEPVAAGNFEVYEVSPDVFLAIAPDVAMITNNIDTLPAVFTGLEAAEGYVNTLAALPADDYNLIAYLDYAALFEALPQMSDMYTPEMMAMFPNYFVMGATILDGSVLTIDAATDMPDGTMADMYTTPLNPDFAAFIPNDTDLLVHGRDLSGIYDYAITTLSTSMGMMGGMGDMDVEAQIEQALTQFKQFTNIDLREDVLAWMTTDYAIFTSVGLDETLNLVEASMQNNDRAFSDNPTLPVEFGFVIGTSDAEKTAETVTKVATLLKAAVASQAEFVTITDYSEDGANGIEIKITAPVGQNGGTGITLLLASNRDIFYFGTKGAADQISAGDTLLNDPVYAKALTYAVPNQAQFLYTDDEGLTEFFGLFAVAGLGSMMGGMDNEAMFDQVKSVITTLNAVFDHSIISYGVTDDMVVVRMTIAFK